MPYKTAKKLGNYYGDHPGVYKRVIEKKKVDVFVRLFEKIKERVGGYDNAMRELSIGHGTMQRMRQDKYLSEDVARKILDTWENVKNKVDIDNVSK